MKKILITGISGFIGSQSAAYFKAKDFRIIGVDLIPIPNDLRGTVDRYEQLTLPDAAIEQLLDDEGPDYCLHCAGGSSVGFSVEHPEEDFRSHIPPTYGLLNALRAKAPDCRTVYISSAGVYGDPKKLPVTEEAPLAPISPYGFHKMLCELICRQFHELYGLKISIARIFSAYGAGLKKQLLWDIYNKAAASNILNLHGTGRESRDFINVTDIISAFDVMLAKSDFTASAYNLASGLEVTIAEVAALMANYLDGDIQVSFNGDEREGDPLNWRADVTKLANIGFIPKVSLEAGIERYVEWCNEQDVHA